MRKRESERAGAESERAGTGSERAGAGSRRLAGSIRRGWRRFGAAALALAMAGSLGWAQAVPAEAAPVYEIEGEWQAGTPSEVRTGDGVVAVWRYNINDDAPAPSNDPVDDVTVTFQVQGGAFTVLPDPCRTEGVTPVSGISADGATLTCNLGTREQGSAELSLTGIRATAATGELVIVDSQIGEVRAQLPPLRVNNPFAMDMKFDGGGRSRPGTGVTQEVRFPWSLRIAPQSEAGPSSVQYTLDFSNTAGGELLAFPNSPCGPLGNSFAGHPFSGPSHPAERTAPFPGSCRFERVGTSNRFTLTIGGIDYSRSRVPTHDSTGAALPTDWDVIASGELRLYFGYERAGQVGFTASAPVYTGAVTGATSQDLTSNNANSQATIRGGWNGGWVLDQVGLPGAAWTDTSRASAGDLVRGLSGIAAPTSEGSWTAACNVLDTRYVEFAGARTGNHRPSDGQIVPFPGAEGIQHWYYIGNGAGDNVNPGSANYDPNGFTCDTGWGGPDWVNTPPADLSLVKAVRMHVPFSAKAGVDALDPHGVATLYVDSRIKEGVTTGQDIWTWTSVNFVGYGTDGWQNSHRTMAAGDAPPEGKLTPGTRYPYTAGGRDVLRVVPAKPLVTKTADQRVSVPGATVQYTVTYRAEVGSEVTVPNYTLTDVLPAGTSYVAGSASIAPSSVDGRTLTWNLTNVRSNTDHVLTYSVRLPDQAESGQQFTNSVTAGIGGVTATAEDTVRLRDGGLVLLTKTAEASKVPHNGGAAEDSWTVRLTSRDTSSSAFTDTVDVLPYNGDGRGTAFSGGYRLSGPVRAAAGATVYYTAADPATLSDDPDHASNGAMGTVAGNTVGWTTTYTADATAVRVIGPALAPQGVQEFVIGIVTQGARHGDRYVNRAEARTARQQLKMRTSSAFEIGAVNSVTIKKWVLDRAGNWHDANDVDDYPAFRTGDTVPYQIVVHNTGDEPLRNLEIGDDRVDLAALDPLPAALVLRDGKAVIPELLPGWENRAVIDYRVPVVAGTPAGGLVNTACVIPEPVDPEDENGPSVAAEQDCDPAGITVLPSSLSWEKIAAGTPEVERLSGSVWQLTPVDASGEPTGDPVIVEDCVANAPEDCDGSDVHPGAGRFTVDPLEDGRYRLVETRAPAGYQLDPTPRYIQVLGATDFGAPIENEPQEGPVLPLTGGVGSLGFWVGAGVLGALVAAGLLRQRLRAARTL